MAEIHVNGQIESADDFPDNSLFVRWSLQLNGGWTLSRGTSQGQTQTDIGGVLRKAYFGHPISLHLVTRTVQGWPRLNLQVWHHDGYGRQELYGYGSVFVPSSPGEHEIKCNVWRPKGTVREEMMQRFLGGGLQVAHPSVLEDARERMKLQTVSMGSVSLRLSVVTRHLDRFGILC